MDEDKHVLLENRRRLHSTLPLALYIHQYPPKYIGKTYDLRGTIVSCTLVTMDIHVLDILVLLRYRKKIDKLPSKAIEIEPQLDFIGQTVVNAFSSHIQPVRTVYLPTCGN